MLISVLVAGGLVVWGWAPFATLHRAPQDAGRRGAAAAGSGPSPGGETAARAEAVAAARASNAPPAPWSHRLVDWLDALRAALPPQAHLVSLDIQASHALVRGEGPDANAVLLLVQQLRRNGWPAGAPSWRAQSVGPSGPEPSIGPASPGGSVTFEFVVPWSASGAVEGDRHGS